jgi:hypothetical protein
MSKLATAFVYVACWKCGVRMEIRERDYTHGLACGKC